MTLGSDNIEIQALGNTVKNIPPSLLGWVGVFVIAGYLVLEMAGNVSHKIDMLIEAQNRSTLAIEKIIQKLTDCNLSQTLR